jgi:hypothetical protein
MAEYYGERSVELDSPLEPGHKMVLDFDFSALKKVPCSIDLDAGAASYWSEIAAMQTLDNLLMQGKISTVEYLKRLPAGQITDRDALVEVLQRDQMMQMGMMPPEVGAQPSPTDMPEPPLRGGPGNAALQRKINETGEVPGM